ncbi:MAG: hypothetical protein GZ094_17090 [Mariniphaga sp.]|nr:hypothetical protein [Mariniphaga sp.]
MTKVVHQLIRSSYVLVVLMAFAVLGYSGFSFYNLPIEERYFHADYAIFKPSGLLGHGLGIIGTLLILFGVFSYMARKRFHIFSRLGVLKYWLEFHIFLCSLGPVLILYHTSFKFGGIVSVSFWSLVAVVASGIIGRFIYLQIPHSIEGRELSWLEVQNIRDELNNELKAKYDINISEIKTGKSSEIVAGLKALNFSVSDFKNVKQLIMRQRLLTRKMARLDMMQNIFKYWHVAHLPFALVMLIVMLIHVVVVLTFGYKWIF